MRSERLIGGAALWLCVMNAGVALAQPLPTVVSVSPDLVRQEFMLAMQRVRERGSEPADSAALATYVIHDYLTAARLRHELALNPHSDLDHAIDGFLRAHVGQPVARALRREWLTSLASRAQWDWFLPRAGDVTEAPLICSRLSGRLSVGDTAGLATEAMARWNLPQHPPEECTPVFAWLRAQGLLTRASAEARARAALAANDARLAAELLNDVPAPRSPALTQWLLLLESPRTTLASLAAKPDTPVEADALAAGFSRLSFSESASATALLPALLNRPDMTPALRARLQRAAALGAAANRAPGAVAAFAALPSDPADVQVQEWRVRSALWNQDYSRALAWLEQMPPVLGAQPRWRYWRARSLEATAGLEAATPFYATIASTRDYYGYLAADRLQQNYNLNIRASPDDRAMQNQLAEQPALQRAHELFSCEMADDAAAEWSTMLASATPAVKVQAAHLAARWGWYWQTIATLAQAGEWDDVPLRYPHPYADLVEEASERTHVPADWIFAIMRQESLFRKDAVSRADARGLMQMQPGTAAAVARHAHLATPTRSQLFDPPVAIELGAAYVRELLDKYKGQLDQSLAAYNAGPAAVARWLPSAPIDADIWIENIPYTETRGYVQHILEHIEAFAGVSGAQPPRLGELLPPVEPAAAMP